MRKPSIGILHFTCPPVVGGVEVVIAATARLFADAGYPVQVLAGHGSQFDKRIPVTIIRELDSNDPQVLAVNEVLDKGEVNAAFQRLSEVLYLSLRNHLASLDICIVHNALSLHFNLPLTAGLHQLASDPAAPRVIAWCHDLSWTNPLYVPKMRERPPWNFLKQRISGVEYVVVSQERRRELARLFGVEEERLHMVPNGIDPARFFSLSPMAARIAEAHNLFSQDLVLWLPARITPRKNVELAIQVTGSLTRRGLATKLVVTGPPDPHNPRSVEYVNALQDLRRQLSLADRVVFVYELAAGTNRRYTIPGKVLTDLFTIGDLLFFPSAQEGFGIPILEAGLARLPVFCSDIPPFKEVGAGDVHIFSLEDSPDRIADAIVTFTQSDPSHRLRKRVLGQYTWPAIFRERIEPLVSGSVAQPKSS